MSADRVYLGDSVYVAIERGMVKLTTDNGDGPTNTIYLGTDVMRALLAWYDRVVNRCNMLGAPTNDDDKGV
jgi:hypothetical protein